MYIHTFGAYFGLGAAFFFQRKAACDDTKKDEKERSNIHSYVPTILSFVGTLYLFTFFPSFNAANGASN
jgi:Ammonium Transporter Family